MCEVGLKECFTILLLEVMGSCRYQIVKGVIIPEMSWPAEFWPSSRTFALDLDLHISFTSRIAMRKRSESVTFPKTLKRKPGQKKWKGEKFDKAKKYDLTLCLPRESRWTSLLRDLPRSSAYLHRHTLK